MAKDPQPEDRGARTVLLTGATRGLGRAALDRLAAGGHTVLGCGRDAARIADLTASFAAPHDFAVVDVTDPGAVSDWAVRLLDSHGPPDLLLNNAALINRPAPLWEVPATEFGDVIDVNIKGVANVIRAFAPPMIARGRGVIVNFSSGWGRGTSPGMAPYCATKWAIEGLTQALSQELPAGMAAVAFSPGVIDTDMLRTGMGDAAAGHIKADEWAARAVPFLLRLGPRDNGRSLDVS